MFSLSSFRSKCIEVLHLRESPHRTALAFAIGVFIAFSPTYGLHTLSVVFCAWAFRLNFLALFLGALINNPWTLIPILGGTLWTGVLLLDIPSTPAIDWEHVTTETLWHTVSPYILPFVLGGCVLGAAAALIAYPLARWVLSRYRTAPVNTPERKGMSQ